MKKVYFLLTTIFLFSASLKAADFGLLLDQNASVGGTGAVDPAVNYEALLIPRLLFPLGDSGDLYLSAGFTFGYEEDMSYVPELLRTELSWRFNARRFNAPRFGDAKIRAGRIPYSAPCDWLAEGLFDGLQFVYNTQAGNFNIGAWYTGFLYKKNVNIIMTAEDVAAYHTALDYDNFTDTYFASRRVIAALGWEHPVLAELVRTKFAVIAQTDFNDRDDYLHSQYITAKIGIPVKRIMFELAGVLELAESASSEFNMGLAGELGFFWNLPSSAFPSRLSLNGYFFSGHTENANQGFANQRSGSIIAFTPITAQFFGDILEARPSGISTINLDYTARFHETFSLGITSSYFIRNDLGTYTGYPVNAEDNDGYFLGNEFFARLVWSPVSDLQINLGGGAFLPVMGNTAPDREPLWRVKLAAILVLY